MKCSCVFLCTALHMMGLYDEPHIPDVFPVRSRVKSSSEEPACCNVPRVSSFFSPERARARQRERERGRQREREKERELSYILVGQPHPEGWGEDEKGRGGEESRRKERGEHSILGNMRRAKESRVELRRGIKWPPPSPLLENIRERLARGHQRGRIH